MLATRALNSKPSAIDLVRQVLTDTVFSETDRIKEILTQKALGWQSRLTSSGHAYAMQTASRAMSALAVNEYVFSGLPALNALNAFWRTMIMIRLPRSFGIAPKNHQFTKIADFSQRRAS